MSEALPYPFDPPPHEGSNTAAHDAVRALGITSTTPVEQIDELLRANPTVMCRLAATLGLYAIFETVADRARELLATEAAEIGPAMEPATKEAAAGQSGEKAPKGQKMLKDNSRPKQSGLKEGDKRTPRTNYFKYEVVQYYRRMQMLKELGVCPDPGPTTAEHFGGITKGQISAWAKLEESLRQALLHVNVIRGRGKRVKLGSDKLVPFTSRAARRCTLRKGGCRRFAAAEEEVYSMYREKRRKGLRVTAHYLRVLMKKTVGKHYGDEAAATFKASGGWLSKFTRHYDMSLRRKTNKKHLSVEERLPKCKRWHARLRRRLKGGPKAKLDPTWGRWLPADRLSIDQVPCNLREGDGRTYAHTGEKRVWLAGSKADCGKRFCTLQVAARCANGDKNKPRHGQPKLTIAFRGQGEWASPRNFPAVQT